MANIPFPGLVTLPKIIYTQTVLCHEKTCFLHMQKTKVQINCPVASDQRLCFCYIDYIETMKTDFIMTWLICEHFLFKFTPVTSNMNSTIVPTWNC